MQAIILSIGDELVLGQTVDTNSAWLSQQLAAIGLPTAAHVTVGDEQRAIVEAIGASAKRSDFLIISGGIGPTADDLTRAALAEAMGMPLDLHEPALRALQGYFDRLNRPMAKINEVQAYLPRTASMIENSAGTAPGIDARLGGCRIFVMPGVPREMKTMFARDVLPALTTAGGGAAIRSRTLHTFGVGESNVGQMLGPLMDRQRNPSVGTTVANGIVSLRLNSRFDSPQQAIEALDQTEHECRQILGELIFGHDEQSLASVVAAQLMTSADRPMVTTAESCTGGLLAKMLTDVAGSSAYFAQGWVTYANEAKSGLLGVDAKLIAEHGAVSELVAAAMAVQAAGQGNLPADRPVYALSISGIAGPDGGTEQKPVGTVCIALALRPKAEAQRASAEALSANAAESSQLKTVRTFRFSGDREFIRDRSAKMALTMLRFALLGKAMPF